MANYVNVHGAIARPGDKLVVATDEPWDEDDMRRLKEVLPGVEFILVQAHALVAYRPEERDSEEVTDG